MKTLGTTLTAGLVIGILMAPEKGSKTREKMKAKADDFLNRLQNIKNITGEELEELKEVFKNEIAGLKDETRKKVHDILQSAKAAPNRLEHRLAS
ncbi:MAG: YtxH domain-containing protein [Sphingobacteriales bacterium]|nr:YtxH domain-containing protein [Sphingobacteriales bacterium]MBI3720711.1 YtxH domain-containing protein [Sphingobacteriales bacterium]